VLVVYTVAIFLSATLLFLVQPMVGKLVLPALGGTPAVWNTCMVFFQSLLLVGYAYAHLVTRYLGARTQAVVHACAALGPLALLPIALPAGLNVPSGESPVGWLLGVLAVMTGVPFLLLSTNGPLIQRWFSATDHPRAGNPYFLYAASNTGSLLALLGYPILVEPWLTLKEQGKYWAFGYAALAVLLIVCAVFRVARAKRDRAGVAGDSAEGAGSGSGAGAGRAAISWKTRGLWVLLAFAPSSLMIGATTFISTDVAPAPLMWVVPLAIYLVTMILAFSRFVEGATRLATFVLPLAVLALTVSLLMEAREPLRVLVTLHLVTLAAGAMACHGRLSLARPDPTRLTEYYLLMSVGGALGGVFNAIVAPVTFNRILEYPIAMVVSVGLALLLAGPDPMGGAARAVRSGLLRLLRMFDPTSAESAAQRSAGAPVRKPAPAWLVPIGFGTLLFVTSLFITIMSNEVNERMLVIKLYIPAGVALAMIVAAWRHDEGSRWRRWTLNLAVPVAIGALYVCLEFANALLAITDARQRNALALGLPVLACYLLLRWPWRFTGGVAALLTLAAFSPGLSGFPILTERTFFGVHRVVITASGGAFQLMHGTTEHGAQLRVPELAAKPTTYYHPTGPVGDVFDVMNAEGRIHSVGCVGLGIGTIAAYSEPGQAFTFYEIDPSIIHVARDATLPDGTHIFTYIRDAEGTIEYKVGDGRRLLDLAEGVSHDLIILDAFSSDAIPMHLLTVEAFEVYLKRLSEHGVLLVHTSNRHLLLVNVLSGIADRLGLAIKVKRDVASQQLAHEGKNTSEWVAIARRWEDLEALDHEPGWFQVTAWPGVSKVWTDDFSDIVSVMR